MKDSVMVILLCVVLIISILTNITQDRRLSELQEAICDMSEQIAYIEGEIE